MSVAKLERFNLGVAIDNDPDGLWCRHASHLASVAHLEKRIRELEAIIARNDTTESFKCTECGAWHVRKVEAK